MTSSWYKHEIHNVLLILSAYIIANSLIVRVIIFKFGNNMTLPQFHSQNFRVRNFQITYFHSYQTHSIYLPYNIIVMVVLCKKFGRNKKFSTMKFSGIMVLYNTVQYITFLKWRSHFLFHHEHHNDS